MDIKQLSSNWKKLQATFQDSSSTPISAKPSQNGLKRKRPQGKTTTPRDQEQPEKRVCRRRIMQGQHAQAQTKADIENNVKVVSSADASARNHVNAGLSTTVEIGKYIALDCEMVGVGPDPDRESVLARASIVNYNGEQVYDSYVRPKEAVTDWRTHVSGIAPKHMVHARTLEEVQQDVAKILKDRIVIGHTVRHDFDALLLDHPKRDIRDTARHGPYRKIAGGVSPKLKILTSELLGLEIQAGEHSSIEDARACMLLFRRDKDAFEREHAKKWPTQRIQQRSPNDEDASTTSKPKKKKKQKKKKR